MLCLARHKPAHDLSVDHLLHLPHRGPASAGIDLTVKRRGHVIFIDVVNEVTRERSMSYLKPEHQERVADAYHAFKDVEGFAKVASLDNIRANDGNLSIRLYVRGKAVSDEKEEYAIDTLSEAVKAWEVSSESLHNVIFQLVENIKNKRE